MTNYMNFKELKIKSRAELQKLLSGYKEKLRDLRFKIASKQVKNVREMRRIKKSIAQVLTLLRNKKD